MEGDRTLNLSIAKGLPMPRRIPRKAPLDLALWLEEVNRGFLTTSRYFACYRSTPGFRIVPSSTGENGKLVFGYSYRREPGVSVAGVQLTLLGMRGLHLRTISSPSLPA